MAILHEDLQQLLVALRYEVETLRGAATRAAKETVFDDITGVLDKAIRMTRSLSVDLRPPGLHDLGLGEALAWVADDMKSRFRLNVRLSVAPAAELVRTEVRGFIVEAVRELLFNVVKHAGVKAAELRVRLDGDRIKVDVKDRGKGSRMAPNSSSGLGLLKIRERADYLGGEFRIVSSPRKGTRAALMLPRG